MDQDAQLDAILGNSSPSPAVESANNNVSDPNGFDNLLNSFSNGNGEEAKPEGATNQAQPNLQPGQVLIDGKPFTIHEKYRNLDPQTAIYRTMQSEKDQLTNQFNQVNNEVTQLRQIDTLFNLMQKDKNVLKSFASKLYPDLFPKVDPQQFIKSKLAEEFGSDFKFDRSEAESDLFSDHAKYLDRYNELRKEATQSGELPQTFEEVLKAKETAINQENQNKLKIRNDAIRDMNSNEQEYNDHLKLMHYLISDPRRSLKLYRTLTQKNGRPGSPLNAGSGPVNQTIQSQLDTLLGPRIK